MKRRLVFLSVIAFTFLVGTSEASTIDTLSNWSGSIYIAGLGEPLTATMGQTFRLNAGDDTILDAVTFIIDDIPISSPHIDDVVRFAFYLYEWDGNKISGSSLFTGPEMATTFQPTDETFVVNTGGVGLSVGTDYVWFLSTSNFFNGLSSHGMIAQNPHAYDYGHFVYMDNQDDFNLLSSNNWQQWVDNDLAFTMEFSPVPVPSAVIIGSLGLMFSGWMLKRKRMI